MRRSDFYQQKSLAKPKTLACFICGREFGTKSLVLHLKSCKEKFINHQSQKDPLLRIKLPQEPELFQTVLEQAQKGCLDEQILEQYNEEARNIFKYKILPACQFCGRTFNEQSLSSHVKACPKKNSINQQQTEYGYKLPDEMKKPRTLVCCVCGRQFGLTSLKIHYPQCKQKLKNQESKKPLKQRNPIPSFTEQEQNLINTKTEWTVEQIEEFNRRASQNYRDKALVHCQNCKRKFLPEPYKRHLKNCKFINGDNVANAVQARQSPQKQKCQKKSLYEPEVVKKPKVLMCHICGREFGLTSLKIHQKTCIDKFLNQQLKRLRQERRPLPVLNVDEVQYNLKDAENWPVQKIQRYNELANEVYKGCALFPCKICGRKFFESALSKHFTYCLKNQQKQNQLDASREKDGSLSGNKIGRQTSSPNKGNKSSISSSKNADTVDQNVPSEIRKAEKQNKLISEKPVQISGSNGTNFNNTIKQVSEQLEKTTNDNQLAKVTSKIQNETHTNDYQDKNSQQVSIDRIQCSKCNRKFAVDRIVKHESICKGRSTNKESTNSKPSLTPKEQQQKKDCLSKDKPASKQKQLSNQAVVSQTNQKDEDFISQLESCPKCGKKIIPSKLEKHVKNCKDVAFAARLKQKLRQDNEEPQQQTRQHDQIKLNQGGKQRDSPKTKLNQLKDLVNETKASIGKDPPEKSCEKINVINCKYCKRKFDSSRIQKHETVCLHRKSHQSDQESKLSLNKQNAQNTTKKQQQDQKNQNYKHQVFGKQINQPIQLDKESTPELVKCQKCERKFNADRIEKHSAVCKGTLIKKTQQKLQENAQKINKTQQRLQGNAENISKTQTCFRKNNQAASQSNSNAINNRVAQHQNTSWLSGYSKNQGLTPESNKKTAFNIKNVPTAKHQREKSPLLHERDRTDKIKQNLKITEDIINEIWDTKEKGNFNKKAKGIPQSNLETQSVEMGKVNKTAGEAGFYHRKLNNQSRDPVQFQQGDDFERVACQKCGRNFTADRITKHQSICKGQLKGQLIDSNNRNRQRYSNKKSSQRQSHMKAIAQGFQDSIDLPQPRYVMKQFKEIKNMKMNESTIDRQIDQELNILSSKNTQNEIKSIGFAARSTYGGGQRFYKANNQPQNMKSPNYPAVFQQSSLIKTPKNLPSIPSEVKKWKK